MAQILLMAYNFAVIGATTTAFRNHQQQKHPKRDFGFWIIAYCLFTQKTSMVADVIFDETSNCKVTVIVSFLES